MKMNNGILTIVRYFCLYYKRKNDATWAKLIAGQDLGHDFYYPYVLVNSEGGFHILAVQVERH